MDPVHRGGPWTRGPCFILSQNNKGDSCELSVSIYLSMLRTKRNQVRGDFDYPVNTDGFWWDI